MQLAESLDTDRVQNVIGSVSNFDPTIDVHPVETAEEIHTLLGSQFGADGGQDAVPNHTDQIIPDSLNYKFQHGPFPIQRERQAAAYCRFYR